MPALLGSLTPEEHEVEERLRTLALCMCAGGVVGYAVYWLRSVLVPLVLAVALRYLLQPLIDALTMRPFKCCGRTACRTRPTTLVETLLEARLPYWLGVCVALTVAFATLALIGFVVADSVHVFTSHAEVYGARVQELTLGAFGVLNRMQARLLGPSTFSNVTLALDGNLTSLLGVGGAGAAVGTSAVDDDDLTHRLMTIGRQIPVTSLVVHGLTSLMEAVSNLFLVMLFTIYLLLGTAPPPVHQPAIAKVGVDIDAQADAQIHGYIQGAARAETV